MKILINCISSIVITILGIGMGYVALIAYAMRVSYVDNNKILDRYAANFAEISHPLDTSSIVFRKGVYPPPGNGSHCYYFIIELRKFSGNKKDITDFYQKQNIQIEFAENNKLSQYIPYGFDDLNNWELHTNISRDRIYAIYALNTDFDNYDRVTFDLRCH